MSPHERQLPAALEQLFEGHIVSVGTVELLMLLYDDPEQSQQLDQICAALSCPGSWAEVQLDALRRAGLVDGTPESGYTYEPATAGRARAVEALAHDWRRDRVLVSRRIFASARPVRRKGR